MVVGHAEVHVDLCSRDSLGAVIHRLRPFSVNGNLNDMDWTAIFTKVCLHAVGVRLLRNQLDTIYVSRVYLPVG